MSLRPFSDMDIKQVADIMQKISDGFESACAQCLADNRGVVTDAVREQLYSGQDGAGNLLSPSYDDDPYFQEEGPWKGRAADYREWKMHITPPQQNFMLPIGLPPRPDNIPNLFINGKFYSEINGSMSGDVLVIDPGIGNGLDIVGKYGDMILNIGPTAVEFFNKHFMFPAISEHFEKCGYK